PYGKKTGANFSVGSDPDPAAMAAEGMRHRRDDSYFSNPVLKAVTPRCLAACVRNFDQRPVFRHPAEDFIQRDHRLGRPHSILFQWHEFDEPHDNTFFARKHAKRDDLIFVEATHEHAIDLHRPEARTASGSDSRQDIVETVRNACYSRKALGIDGIHAYRDSIKTRTLQRLRHIGE